jgi:hypothetical protein
MVEDRIVWGEYVQRDPITGIFLMFRRHFFHAIEQSLNPAFFHGSL